MKSEEEAILTARVYRGSGIPGHQDPSGTVVEVSYEKLLENIRKLIREREGRCGTCFKLERKLSNQKRELGIINQSLKEKNLALDAMHWVWCDGGCEGGVHRFHSSPLTEEIVSIAERNTERLRNWFETKKLRAAEETK